MPEVGPPGVVKQSLAVIKERRNSYPYNTHDSSQTTFPCTKRIEGVGTAGISPEVKGYLNVRKGSRSCILRISMVALLFWGVGGWEGPRIAKQQMRISAHTEDYGEIFALKGVSYSHFPDVSSSGGGRGPLAGPTLPRHVES